MEEKDGEEEEEEEEEEVAAVRESQMSDVRDRFTAGGAIS